jgi:hypothetical protein
VTSEEFRNKNLLAFYLAMMNLQLKAVNIFINKSELLRRIVNKLLYVYQQHTNNMLFGRNSSSYNPNPGK